MRMEYKNGCKSCELTKRERCHAGGIIELDDFWILNHYGAKENNFLGRLVLQPKFHRMELAELTAEELETLGPNIGRVEKALKDYWCERFPSDPLQRVYVVYFFEEAFHPKGEWHLHIHLIARTKRLGRGEPWEIAAWNVRKLPKEPWFPADYQIRDENGREMNKESVEVLMASLRKRLQERGV